MITQNFENLLATVFVSKSTSLGNTSCGRLPVVTSNGRTIYIIDTTFDLFPGSSTTITPTLSRVESGISFGTGNTPPTKRDFNLENTITSGISATVTSNDVVIDSDGTIKYIFKISITNQMSDAITIREIGYKQPIKGSSLPSVYGVSNLLTYACLIDRTVFETPITIQPGDAGVIDYTLQVSQPVRIKNGIKLVPFNFGTDEEIVAMIDGARQGLIDLQSDGLWGVGDTRTINIDAWTGSNNTSHAAHKMDIVISQFGDYNNCGCLFQFDFRTCVYEQQRITGGTISNYQNSEMYTTTLPALVDAFPSWLKDNLKTFDVLAAESYNSSTIITVPNNKLALRSEIEITGTNTYSQPGEGSLIKLYSQSVGPAQKTNSWSQVYISSSINWWTRSLNVNSNRFLFITNNGTTYNGTSSIVYMSVFGCI